MGRSRNPRTKFKPLEVKHPPVIATGQFWQHRLIGPKGTKEPLVLIDRIDMGEEPPRIYFTRSRRFKCGTIKTKLFNAALDQFLRVYEYVPAQTTAEAKNPRTP